MSSTEQKLNTDLKITKSDATQSVGVIGLGYVGLPMASLCAVRGFDVVGFDISETVVNGLNGRDAHIDDSSTNLLFQRAMATRKLTCTSCLEDLKNCSVYLICVPTPVDVNYQPDFGPLVTAVKSMAPLLSNGDMVVIESTVYPGVCEEIIKPIIERKTSFSCETDIVLAYCPERVNPGDTFWTCENIPRVVGALNKESAHKAANFYSDLLGGDVIDVGDVRASSRPKHSLDSSGQYRATEVPIGSVTVMNSIRDAEAVKAMENTIRDVNIAFVNELAKMSDVLGLDLVNIIDGMSTKPFGKGPFFPGAGVGGHCIAVDPEWLKAASVNAGFMPDMLNMARSVNNSMPAYAVTRLKELLLRAGIPISGSQIALLGVAYKKGVSDVRESPFFAIHDILKNNHCRINIYDNHYSELNTHGSVYDSIREVDGVILITDHPKICADLANINYQDLKLSAFVDGRNAIDKSLFSLSGVNYAGIGRR